VAPVDWNLSKNLDVIDVRPCDFSGKLARGLGMGSAIQFDREKPLPPMGNDGRAANSGHLLRSALDSERKEDAAFVFDSRLATSQEPEASAIIEVARVSCPVPTSAIDIELCF
jgi:hypothetical protein